MPDLDKFDALAERWTGYPVGHPFNVLWSEGYARFVAGQDRPNIDGSAGFLQEGWDRAELDARHAELDRYYMS